MTKTIAGRIALLNEMFEMGLITNADDYFNALGIDDSVSDNERETYRKEFNEKMNNYIDNDPK